MRKKQTALERRLARLEKEAAGVRTSMQNLDCTLKRIDPDAAIRLQLPRPGRKKKMASGGNPSVLKRKSGVGNTEQKKIAHYLSGGSFTPVKMSPHDRAVLRNKAVFMVIVLCIAVFVILRLLHII